MDKLISVIVPIYNTAKYLQKCVDSILSQTYLNLQIILVNDGSTDNSLDICKEYALKDSRVIVVDKPNGGLSDARNAGIEKVTGEFISFVDSDDFLYLESFSELLKVQAYTAADIVYMNSISINEDYSEGEKSNRVLNGKNLLSSEEYFEKMCLREQGCSACGGLFKREIFDKYRFTVGKLNEDFLFLSEICLKENLKIALTDYVGYGYYVRANSISRQNLGKSSIDAVYNCNYIKEMAKENNLKLLPFASAYAAYQARTAVLVMPYEIRKKYKEFIKFCRQVLKENFDNYKEKFPNKKDIWFIRLFIICPSFALWFAKIFKRNK